MKYIISESRFDEFISNYLDGSLEDIEEHVSDIDGMEYHWWGIGDSPVFGLMDKGSQTGISFDEQYVSSLSNLFGMPGELAKEHLYKWVTSNLDIKPDFVFEPEMF